MSNFNVRKFLIWYSSKHNNPSAEDVARWQHGECMKESADLALDVQKSNHLRLVAEKNLKAAQSNFENVMERMAILDRTCDQAVAKVHYMERDLKERAPLQPHSDKLFKALCGYAEDLVSLHDRYDDGNAKRFGPAVERMRRHLEKCPK